MDNLVAVYGTLRQNHGNHRILNKSPLSCEKIFGWSMYSMGGFPGCVKSDGEADYIVVELYDIDDETLRRLNQLEGYTEGEDNWFYDRVSVGTSLGEAFMYTWAGSLNQDTRIYHGDWDIHEKENSTWRRIRTR